MAAEQRAEVEQLQHHLLTSRGFTLIDIVADTGLYPTVQISWFSYVKLAIQYSLYLYSTQTHTPDILSPDR